MAPPVELSPQTFARLQAHAIPLVDSIETVINRFIDYYEANDSHEAKDGAPISAAPHIADQKNIRQFNPVTPPDLTFTKVLAIEFNGKPFEQGRMNWGSLLIAAIREAKAKATSASEFQQLVVVNFVTRQKNDEGFRYFPDLGISVQGLDANSTWRGICHIVQKLGYQLQVTFVWRQKPGAAFSGEIGQFTIASR